MRCCWCNRLATTDFIRIFDRIFDVLNSRSVYVKNYKAPFTLSNFLYWNNILTNTEHFIKELKIDNSPVLHYSQKMLALAFLINVKSIRNLALYLLNNQCHSLKYFLTYKISQDHLALYFCCLRSRGGWNDNPIVIQVLWAVRHLFYRNSIKPSINGNIVQSKISILRPS